MTTVYMYCQARCTIFFTNVFVAAIRAHAIYKHETGTALINSHTTRVDSFHNQSSLRYSFLSNANHHMHSTRPVSHSSVVYHNTHHQFFRLLGKLYAVPVSVKLNEYLIEQQRPFCYARHTDWKSKQCTANQVCLHIADSPLLAPVTDW